MSLPFLLERIQKWIQRDIGQRGLGSDPNDNLITACPDDLLNAARSLANHPQAVVGILTGFFIANADPPCAETDGPLGAIFLARALTPLGFRVVLYSDAFCVPALEAGLRAAKLDESVHVVTLPRTMTAAAAQPRLLEDKLTHLIAIERVGPSHTVQSIREQAGGNMDVVYEYARLVPEKEHDRLHTMRGMDITEHMAPGHLLVEAARTLPEPAVTIGIGDGGNEIGMGKIRWQVIRTNINNGGVIACRVPTDYLIVCGISNWGAYGLGVLVNRLRCHQMAPDLLWMGTEAAILQTMVKEGPLVDGLTARQTMSVDGVAFYEYVRPLSHMHTLVKVDDMPLASESVLQNWDPT